MRKLKTDPLRERCVESRQLPGEKLTRAGAESKWKTSHSPQLSKRKTEKKKVSNEKANVRSHFQM